MPLQQHSGDHMNCCGCSALTLHVLSRKSVMQYILKNTHILQSNSSLEYTTPTWWACKLYSYFLHLMVITSEL